MVMWRNVLRVLKMCNCAQEELDREENCGRKKIAGIL